LEKPVFWADRIAEDIIKTRGNKHLVATGITPSGPIHLGNIREVLTADAVRRSLDDAGAETELIYIADTADPLRKVYPFLPKEYEKYVGMPLYRIPCPDGCCENYADHFLKPFLEACGQLGVQLKAYKAHELYREGSFEGVIREALENRKKLAEIIESQTGRQLPEDWVPFNIECDKCKKTTEIQIPQPKSSIKQNGLNYKCGCGSEGTSLFSDGAGKLPWRIDWPARWKVLGVTVEPFGKDHATAGGSYDTGSMISEKVFNYKSPYPILYEWIYWKGKGAMASSTGVAISIQDMLEIIPPEVVRFLILRVRPEKHIDFDPEGGLLKLFEDYQQLEDKYFEAKDELEPYEARTYEMSQVDTKALRAVPLKIPFLHVVIAAQIAQHNFKNAIEVLKRSGYRVDDSDENALKDYLKYADNWLAAFAPDVFKFEVQDELPKEVENLPEEAKAFLKQLADYFKKISWDAEAVHNSIHEIGQNFGLSARKSFQAVYVCLLGKKSGPRAGWFITSLDRDFVINRFKEASGSS